MQKHPTGFGPAMNPTAPSLAALISALAMTPIAPCPADEAAATASAGASPAGPVMTCFDDWFDRVSKTQAEQPRWVTPVATVTPRLEEEVRYDQSWEHLPGGHSLDVYGGKGVELIPAERVEVIIGVPGYESENTSPEKNGWADETFLLKYRILSATKDQGDYILTAFMGLSVPSGSANYTSHHYAWTPTLAFGKGWGDFDFQSTLGVTIPDNGSAPAGTGTPLALNTAFQYHVAKYFWPELEANYTHWPNGKHDGLDQLFLTPGLVVGRIPIHGRIGLTLGLGYQIATTDTPLVRNNFIFSARVPF